MFDRVLPRLQVLATGLFALATLLVLAGSVRAIGSVPKSGIDTSSIDHTCKACDDFYQFAEGNWIKNHPVPAAYSSYGRFTVLSDSNIDELHTILEDLSQNTYAPGTIEQKVGDYYASCMDTSAIEAVGTAPIAKELGIAAELPNVSGLPSTIAELDRDGVASFFSFGGEADLHDSAQTIVDVGQRGLGLPDRDYYLKNDDKTKAIRDAYVTHVTKMFALLGDPPGVAAREASAVLKIETTLATDALGRVALRDPAATDHRATYGDLQALTPNFDWTAFFAAKKLVTTNAINVDDPDFFKGFSTLVGTTPVVDLRAYLRWHVVHAYAGVLPAAFDAENFAFYSTTLAGQKEQQPRWKRCVEATDRNLGEALGQLYVAKTFPASAKAQALAMVRNIKATLRDDFSTLDWMTPATRAKANEKLDAFTLKIGYPDKWRDYSSLPVVRTSYAANAIAANNFRKDDQIAQIGKPVDRTRWDMTPPTVNAYYDPSENEIVFPAGILQPPF